MAITKINQGDTGAVAAQKIYDNDLEAYNAANLAVSKIENVTDESPQLFDYSTALSGKYDPISGATVEGINWARTPLLPIKDGETKLTLNNTSTIGTSSGRVFFYGASGLSSFISAIQSATLPITSDIPAGAKFWSANLINGINVGNNPTASPIVRETMANYGASALPFEPYGVLVDASKLNGLPEAVEKDIAKLDSLTIENPQLFDNSNMLPGVYAVDTGIYTSTSINWISTNKIRLQEGATHVTGAGWGLIGNNAPRFTFWGINGNYVGQTMATGTSLPQTSAIPVGAAFVGARVANVVGVGLNPTASPYANTFMLNYGSEALPFEPYDADGVFLDGTKIKGLEIDQGYAEVYYEVNATGYQGRPSVRIYVRLKGTKNQYVGYIVAHVYNMDELEYLDYYRIVGATFYTFNGVSMVSTGQTALAGGENESVYLCSDRVDFTGGYHGDEILQNIEFYADGKPFIHTVNAPLTPCAMAEYKVKSTTHQTAATGGIVNPAHPVEAVHVKHTIFKDSKYITENYFTWQVAALPVSLWYHAISCIGKPTASIVQNEFMNTATMTGSTEQLLSTVNARDYFGYNSATGLASRATSRLIRPNPEIIDGAYRDADAESTAFVWDRATDSKYYRKNSPLTPIKVGDVWASITEVEFLKH